MKTKRIFTLALSLTLGVMVAPSFAITNGETRVETSRNVTRGTNNGQNGYWIENIRKTYRFTEDAATTTALTTAGIEKVDPVVADKIREKIYTGEVTVANAAAQIQTLAKIAEENRNSDYLETLPAEYLNWAPGKPLSQAVIDKVGAEPREWENRFVNAYNGIDVNPDTKVFTDGPLKGQKLSSDFNTMVDQLTQNGYITQDWNYDTLIADLGGQGTLDSYGQGRGFWASNLFGKENLHDSTLFQRYSSREGQDAATRTWVRSDGIGRFNGANDMDVLMAVNYSTAAKLVAESKALRAMGMTKEADAKLNSARNVVLLDGNDHDPLVLDLNHNGKVDVTGLSSAKMRAKENKRFIKEGSVRFDLLATGKPIQTEWIKDGDGFLVDNTNNAVINAIRANKPLTGANLFGDIEGYPGGFLKLAAFFDNESRIASLKDRLAPGFGTLKDNELKNLMVWIDNGDGKAELSEMKTLPELGITEINTRAEFVKAKGEMLEQAYFIQNGQKHIIQEVWFRSETK